MKDEKEIRIGKKQLILIVAAVAVLVAAAVIGGVYLGRSSQKSSESREEVSKETQEKPEERPKETPVETPEPIPALDEGVWQSAYAAVSGGRIYRGYEDALYSAPLADDGTIGEMKKEMDFPDKIREIIVRDDNLYCNFKSGITRFDLKEKGEGEVVADQAVFDGYWIIDDALIYRKDGNLYRTSVEGGATEEILREVSNCAVTNQGIFYTIGGTRLFCSDLQGENQQEITQVDYINGVTVSGSCLYLKGEDLWVYDTDKKETGKLDLADQIKEEGDILVTEAYVIYDGQSGDTRQYFFETKEDKDCGYVVNAENPYSLQYNGNYYYSFNSDELGRIALDTMEEQEVNMEEHFGESEAALSRTENQRNQEQVSEEAYHIDSNLVGRLSDQTAFIQSDYFYMSFNYDDYANGLWGCEVINPTTISFYYTKARESGNGGKVVTIQAFDWGDNGYEVYPSYKIAALSESKKYIALFPTDLQYDASNPVQQEEYTRMRQFADRIDQNRDDNPFVASKE